MDSCMTASDLPNRLAAWVRDKGWGCVRHRRLNITIIDTVWLEVRGRANECRMPNGAD
jgi:hypothetical protein